MSFTVLKATSSDEEPISYYFLGNEDSYPEELNAILGVQVAPENEKNKPKYKVEELTARGILIRVVVSYGPDDDVSEARLLCERSKILTAMDSLIGVAYQESTIRTARIPRKAVFY